MTVNMRKRIAFSIMDTVLGYKTLRACRLHVELLLRNPAMFFLLCERSIEYLMFSLISCNNIHLILQNTNSNLTFSFIDVSYIYAHTHTYTIKYKVILKRKWLHFYSNMFLRGLYQTYFYLMLTDKLYHYSLFKIIV